MRGVETLLVPGAVLHRRRGLRTEFLRPLIRLLFRLEADAVERWLRCLWHCRRVERASIKFALRMLELVTMRVSTVTRAADSATVAVRLIKDFTGAVGLF